MNQAVQDYNRSQTADRKAICEALYEHVTKGLPGADNKLWHGAPVWFFDGNPIVGYDVLKDSVRLLFWSGQSFEVAGLKLEGSFKAAEIRYTDVNQVDGSAIAGWLKQAELIQWDYKNIVKRKGELRRLK